MNEFGIDTAFGNVITTAMATQLSFAIPRIGTFGYGLTGTTAYYSKQLSVDSAFLGNCRTVLSAGKYCGCYIFSYAWDETAARAEANRVCDYLDNNNVTLNFPVFFDWERTGAGTQGSYEMVTAAGVSVTPALVRNMTNAFMSTVAARGRRSGWYQSAGDLNEWWSTSTIAAARERFYLWVAQWASSTSYADSADLWQYAGDVTWNGIDADLNRVLNDRIFSGPAPVSRSLPLWLLFKIAQNNKPKPPRIGGRKY